MWHLALVLASRLKTYTLNCPFSSPEIERSERQSRSLVRAAVARGLDSAFGRCSRQMPCASGCLDLERKTGGSLQSTENRAQVNERILPSPVRLCS